MILDYSGLKKIGFLVNDLETAPITTTTGEKINTKARAKVYRSKIKNYLRKVGYSETIDITEKLKIKKTLVGHALNALIKSGELERTKLKAKNRNQLCYHYKIKE
jgi:predicted ArsR family transcriptional regulator